MSKNVNLIDLIYQLFGIKVALSQNPLTNVVNSTVTKILASNPRRVGLVINNLSDAPIYISPFKNVSSTTGIYIGANGGSASLIWDRDFEACSSEWYGISTADSKNIWILSYEIINN